MIIYRNRGGAMAFWVENQARRAKRNLLWTNGLIVALLLAAVGVQYQYCANFVLGCARVDASEIAGLTSATQRWRNFVTVRGSKSASSGFADTIKHVEKGTSRVTSTEVSDEYIYLKVGDKILLVQAPPGKEELEYSGELVPTRDQVTNDLVQPLSARDRELAGMVLPFTLNASDYREGGYWGLGIGLPLFLLASWNCSKALRRNTELQTTKVWRHLAAYGNVEQLSTEIEADLQSGAAKKYGDLRVTQSWLIKESYFSTWVSPITDLAWAYKKVTKHSVNFIPTGKTYAVVLVGRHRQRVEQQMKEKATIELLTHLATYVPWALYGFDQRLADAERKDPAGFVALVDSRYQQFKSKSTAPPP